jgi:basic membrane protein A
VEEEGDAMSLRRLLIVLVALTMVATGAAAPAAASHGTNGTICIVNDLGGDGNPFNASAAEGARAAEAKLHVDVEIADAETEAEIIANIDSFVSGGECDLIVGIGFIVAGPMEDFIVANPAQRFAVIDFTFFPSTYPNVADVFYLPNEAAFLAGYVAAGISETEKVGVFGGVPIPPVTLFMDGYALGVEYYNSVAGTSVEVLGWDPGTQTGLFSFDFQDPAAGQALASDLYHMGADTVFPVAGVTSLGALTEATERTAAGESVRVIGVDFDFHELFGDPERVILTSVVKDTGVAVFNQAAAVVDGTWAPGFAFEGLESGGVDISPFHKLNRAVPGFLKNDLKSIRAGIIDGSIPTLP